MTVRLSLEMIYMWRRKLNRMGYTLRNTIPQGLNLGQKFLILGHCSIFSTFVHDFVNFVWKESNIKYNYLSILARIPLVGATDSFLCPNPFITVLLKCVKRVEQMKVSGNVVNRKTTLRNQLKTGQSERIGGPFRAHWPKFSPRGTVILECQKEKVSDFSWSSLVYPLERELKYTLSSRILLELVVITREYRNIKLFNTLFSFDDNNTIVRNMNSMLWINHDFSFRIQNFWRCITSIHIECWLSRRKNALDQ